MREWAALHLDPPPLTHLMILQLFTWKIYYLKKNVYKTAHLLKTIMKAKKCDKGAGGLTLFISTFHFLWYTVPHWCWGLEQLTKQKRVSEMRNSYYESYLLLWVFWLRSHRQWGPTHLSVVCGSLPPSSGRPCEDVRAPVPLHTEHSTSPPLVLLSSSCILKLELVFFSWLLFLFLITFLNNWILTLLLSSPPSNSLRVYAVGMVLKLSCCRGGGDAGGRDGWPRSSDESNGCRTSCSSSAS